jgi:hypothetical protein
MQVFFGKNALLAWLASMLNLSSANAQSVVPEK